MKSLVAIDSKPCRNESIFRDVIALNQIPPQSPRITTEPKTLNTYKFIQLVQKAMVSSTPDNGNGGNGEGGNEDSGEAPDPAA